MKKSSKLIEGVIAKELIRHKDERGYFEELIRITDEFFQEGFGQLSHSYMNKGVIKAWHIHKTQIDWWYVAKGTLKVALYDLRKDSPTYRELNQFILGEDGDDVVLKIPGGVAHGCKVISEDAELFYITSSIYNTAEEGRISHDDREIGFDWINL
ncbi:dTDP-4-dehydrorhamnose 3,5-epimerase family protein [Candidatus Gottesmanbacteria bacterium]|nr:dTDP-4-dehydrorhamnose 3,5-epimerase family protein [Candidatus Gottesmanbacteria bacterium]